MKWSNELSGCGGSFIAPKRNLLAGLSETRTCLGWRSDMFSNSIWNLALALDMFGAGA
jgi:hypothetical protein